MTSMAGDKCGLSVNPFIIMKRSVEEVDYFDDNEDDLLVSALDRHEQMGGNPLGPQ